MPKLKMARFCSLGQCQISLYYICIKEFLNLKSPMGFWGFGVLGFWGFGVLTGRL